MGRGKDAVDNAAEQRDDRELGFDGLGRVVGSPVDMTTYDYKNKSAVAKRLSYRDATLNAKS
jgi:hypothetical protein